MKTQNNLIVLLLLALIISILVAARPASSSKEVLPVMRAQQIELVDKNGKIRVSIKIEDGGEAVFRMMDEDQSIRVKIGASRDGSGFVLLNDETNPGIHALAKKDRTSFTITDQAGKKKEWKP